MPNATHALQVWKSSNNGASWVRIVNDAAKAGYFMGCCLSAAGILHFVIEPWPVAGSLALYRLNLADDSFLTDDLAGPSGYMTGKPIMAAAYSDGRIMVSYRKTGVGFGYLIWNAGSWGAFQSVSADTLDPDWIVKENLGERMHLFAAKNLGAAAELYHVAIEAGGTVDTVQLLPTLSTAVQQGVGTGQPAISADDTQVLFPYVLASTDTLRALRAVPAANPVWSDELVPTSPWKLLSTVVTFGWYIPYAVATAGRMTVTFAAGVFPSYAGAQGWLYETHTDLLSGGWSTPTLVYQAPAGSLAISHWSIPLGGSDIGTVVGTLNAAQFFGAGTKYLALGVWFLGPVVPVLSVSCGNPPNGTVGVPYSHTIPYGPVSEFTTLSLSSGEQSVPSGLRMSGVGVISGTPTMPGDFPFTVRVTDSLGNFIEANCSIAILAVTSSGTGNVTR